MNRKLFSLVTILFIAALFVIATTHIKTLRMESNFVKFLPPDEPSTKLFDRINSLFGGNDMTIVVIGTEEVFSTKFLNRLKDLTEKIKGLKDVKDALSLTNALDVKKTEDGIDISELLPNGTCEGEECKRIKKYVLSKEQFAGFLVSNDSKYAACVIFLKSGTNYNEFTGKLEKTVKSMFPDNKTYFGGIPFFIAYGGKYNKKDMKRLVPLAIILILLIIFIIYKKIHFAILPVIFVLISIFLTFGFMAFLKKPLTFISVAIPVLLLAIGNDYLLHSLVRFYEVDPKKSKWERIKETIKKAGGGILLASGTTIIGFLSLVTSKLILMRDFGEMVAFGMFLISFMALTALPLILSTFSRSKNANTVHSEKKSLSNNSKLPDFLTSMIFNHTNKIIVISFITVLLIVLGIFRLKRAVDFKTYHPDYSPPKVAAKILDEHFSGSSVATILFDTKKDGGMKTPENLNLIRSIELKAGAIKQIRKIRSIADMIMEMNYSLNGKYAIPKTKEGIESLYLLIDGKEELSNIVESKNRLTLISGMSAETNTETFKTIFEELKKITKGERVNLVAFKLPQRSFKIFSEELHNLLLYYGIKIDKKKIENFLTSHPEEKFAPPASIVKKWKNRVLTFFEEESLTELSDHDFKLLKNKILKLKNRDDIENLALNLSELVKKYKDLPKDIESIHRIFNEMVENSYVNHFFDQFLKKFKISLTADMIKKAKGILFTYLDNNQYAYKKVSDTSKTFAGISGTPELITKIDRYVIQNLYQSIAVAIFFVFLLIRLFYRSAKVGLLIVLPLSLTILMFFGIMGIFGIPLGFATANLGAIAIGVGIDYNIHFYHRFEQEFSALSAVKDALRKTYKTTGKVILTNAVSTGFGLFILLASCLTPLQQFGLLAGLTMLASFMFSMFLLPSLIVKFNLFKTSSSDK